jgi:rare lipoprotein A
LERETRGQLRSRMNDSLDEMKNMGRTKQLVIAMAVANVMAVWMAGARAQTAEEGIANFYSDKFQGKKTGSGELYDKDALTASHKKLSYGTKVKVTNIENGKSVVVTINDRMKKLNPAVIDLTRHAVEELGFSKTGKTKVKLEVEK